MPTVYPSLSIGAPARLALFKREAARPGWTHPRTWRDVCLAPLRSQSGLSQGLNGSTPTWYAESPQFRHEKFASEFYRGKHQGWYGDTENQEKLMRGIVAMLPHGRFLTGYHCADNDERVYYPEIFTDETDAARIADEHARVSAEQEDEYSHRWNEAMRLDGLIEDKTHEVETAFALRNHHKLGAAAREEVKGHIADIRAFQRDREALKVD